MASSKRKSQPKLDQLLHLCDDAKDQLDSFLALDLQTIENNIDDLKKYVAGIKKCSREFSNVCHDCICSLLNSASIQEANEYRDMRKDKKQETKEMISQAICYLRNNGFDDEISNVATDCTSNYGGRTESVINDFGGDKATAASMHSDLSFTTVVSPSDNPTFPMDNLEMLARSDNIAGGYTHTDGLKSLTTPLWNSTLPNLNQRTGLLGLGTLNKSAHSMKETEEDLTLTNVQKDTTLLSGPCTTTMGFSAHSRNDWFPRKTIETATVGEHLPPMYSNVIPQEKIVTATVGSNVPPLFSTNNNYRFPNSFQAPPRPHYNLTQPLLPPENKNYPHNYFIQDSCSLQILKQQLFEKVKEPFCGQPQFYHAWMNGIKNKTLGLQLTAWDQILILEANTTGEPLQIVKKHKAISGSNPSQALHRALKELEVEFGSSIRIANELTRKVDNFPQVKSPYQTSKLRELLNICEYIESNMHDTKELGIYNSAYGAQKIWLKLPEPMQNSWRAVCDDFRTSNHGEYPPFSLFVRFLTKKTREYCDPLFQRSEDQNNNRRKESTILKTDTKDTPPSNNEVSETHTDLEHEECPLHKNSFHPLTNCRKFAKMTHKDKLKLLKSNGLCFSCFGKHLRSTCTKDLKCAKCNGSHNTLLHFDKDTSNATSLDSPNVEANLCTRVCGSSSESKDCSKILLVDVFMKNEPTKTLRCYAILDEQSGSTFADPMLADYFGISGPTMDYNLNTLSGTSMSTEGIIVKDLVIRGVGESRKFVLPPLYTNPFIPDCKSEVATKDVVRAHPHIRHLAKHFHDLDAQAQVMILLGRDSGPCMLTRCFGYKPPFVHHTSLGWALVGNCCVPSGPTSSHCVLKTSKTLEHFDHSAIFKNKNKWQLPDVDIFAEKSDDECIGISVEDRKFLEKVHAGVSLNNDGNIVLPLPFKERCPKLPDNRNEVYARSRNTLGRLARNARKLADCLKVMEKYIQNHHVEMVPPEEQLPKRPGNVWWIPVFPVIHPKKGKVRIVFDSSAKYQGTCLNDILLPGSDINNRLKDVLLGFRRYLIGFSGDVETMFHNFRLVSEERDYMRFFWYRNNDPSKDICQYRATVHVFGNCSSPALAAMGLRFAVSSSNLEHVKRFINEQFYVDDGLSCADTVEESVQTLRDTKDALSNYRIRLHKICSSSQEVLESFPESETALSSTVDLSDKSAQSALGLNWEVSTDRIILKAAIPERPFTRRGVLATVNSVFDPLGICAPVVLEGKLLQRKLLVAPEDDPAPSISWDDEISDQHKDEWISGKNSLEGLSGLAVNRCYKPRNFGLVDSVELHGFCDASTDGTGYVIYIRFKNSSDKYHVSFVCANSKIVPKAATTIPRLELCAALDLTLAISTVAAKLDIPHEAVHLYSDSMITLGYIRNEQRRFSRYVSRRIHTITKTISSSQWFYVSTLDNPADLASRPQSVEGLKTSCWLPGPAFLWETLVPQPFNEPLHLPETQTDNQTLMTSKVEDDEIESLIKRCSSLKKLINSMRLVMVFTWKLVDAARQKLGVSLAHRNCPTDSAALQLILIHVQHKHFQAVYDDIEHGRVGNFSSLSPFIDEVGLLRVGGRLKHSNLEYENKFPILLPKNAPFTLLVISHFHAKVFHQGRCATLSAIRESGYFIHQASSVIRSFVSKCVLCRRLRLPLSNQRMSDLPKDRLECPPPFTNTGIDIFGPYHVSDGINTRRSSSMKKCWAIIFTCLNSRATHIEPLPGLDISTVKNALRRFFCVRGSCKKIRCDQGSSFVGIINQESSLSKSNVFSELEYLKCEWELNPPKGSHFGGAWERQIQTVKNILTTCFHLLGERVLSRDDLYTFLQEAAAIMNNTPLWEYSSDANDPRPITPGMLLHLRSDSPTVPETYTERDLLSYGSKRWRRIQYLSDQFWTRWKTDYLQTLQKRRKWVQTKRNFAPGDVVIFKDSSLKRYQWPIAKIINVKKSSDGLVRSVELITSSRNANGQRALTRPVTELSLLVPTSV